jgi:hypothetical protein
MGVSAGVSAGAEGAGNGVGASSLTDDTGKEGAGVDGTDSIRSPYEGKSPSA